MAEEEGVGEASRRAAARLFLSGAFSLPRSFQSVWDRKNSLCPSLERRVEERLRKRVDAVVVVVVFVVDWPCIGRMV